MRHPSELFILSLLVDGRRDEDIGGILQEYGLPPLIEGQEVYLIHLRRQANTGRPDGFTGGRPEDREYLESLSIDGLHHPDPLIAKATNLLSQSALKKDIFLGLLGRVDLVDLARHLSNKYDLDLDDQVLRIFRHYYFNVDIVDYADWQLILEEVEQEGIQYLSCLSGGPIVAAYKIGLDRNTTIKDAVNEVVQSLYVTLHEIKAWPANPAKIKMLSDTMSALSKAHNIVSTSDQELAAIAAELKKFKLAKNVEKPKPLAMLSKKVKDA